MRLARIEVLLAALLFSTGGAVVKAIQLSAWQVAGFRAGVAAVVLLSLVPESRRVTPNALAVGVVQAGTFVSFVIANKLTTAAHAVFLQSLAPLWLVFLGPFLLKEYAQRRDAPFVAAIVLAFGLLLWGTADPSATAPDIPLGNTIGTFSGFLWALTLSGLRWAERRSDRGRFTGVSVTMWGCVFGFLACLPLALPVQNVRPLDWALIGYLGVFQVGLAYVFLTRGIGRVPAVEASLLLLLEPALSPFWAWLVHGEWPGWVATTGGAILVAATVWRSLRGAAPNVAPASEAS